MMEEYDNQTGYSGQIVESPRDPQIILPPGRLQHN